MNTKQIYGNPESRKQFLCIASAAIALLVAVPARAADSSVVTLPVTRSPIAGSTATLPLSQSFIAIPPVAAPTAVYILLPGGNGDIQLTPAGSDGKLGINSTNFLVRGRFLFAAEGAYVITLNAATDFLSTALPNGTGGLYDMQASSQHIADVMQVIAWARATAPGVKVWLIGTSRGTAGAFVAAEYSPAMLGPDGLVFTSPLNQAGDPDSLLSASLAAITVPTLIVSNTEDGCPASNPMGDPAVEAALTSSPATLIDLVSGGVPPLDGVCDALSYYGFFGIEAKVVELIAPWVAAN